MQIPYLDLPQTTRETIDVFGGLDRRPRIPEYAFREMDGMSSDHYPAIGPREKIKRFHLNQQPLALFGGPDEFGYVYIGERHITTPESDSYKKYSINFNGINTYHDQIEYPLDEEPDLRSVKLGADHVFYGLNLWYRDGVNNGRLRFAAEFDATPDNKIIFSLCKDPDGETTLSPTVSASEPQSPQAGDTWIDTSVTPHVLKEYVGYGGGGMWQGVSSTYVRIETQGIYWIGYALQTAKIAAGDTVKISGIPSDASPLSEFNDQYIEIAGIGRTWIVVPGLMDTASVEMASDTLSVAVDLPDMDHVIACGNRLWGCRYGRNENGVFVNEIYASALGNYRQWYRFRGISTDSWISTVGAPGAFTGAINYNGRPAFFKENCILVVSGAYPSQYQLQEIRVPGVAHGFADSLAEMDGLLYYYAPDGVRVFDGITSRLISEALGDLRFTGMFGAAAYRGKYYICLREDTATQVVWRSKLLVYDTKNGLWHCEGISDTLEENAGCLTVMLNRLFAIYVPAELDSDDPSGNNLLLLSGDENNVLDGFVEDDDATKQWSCETGEIGLADPNEKTITRINVRLKIPPGGKVSIYIQYDDTDQWNHVATMHGRSLRAFSLPILPRRCDYFRLRFEGVGDGRIYSITKTIEAGSELP